MSKIKLLLDVIGDLRSLADSLQAVADAVADSNAAEAEMTTTKEPEETGKAGKTGKSAKNTAKKDAKAAKQEPEEKPLTLEEVRAVLAEKSRSGHTEEVRALLNKHGADKLSEIDPAEYPALLAEAEVVDRLAAEGVVTAAERRKAYTIIARRHGLSLDSIFAENA